MRADTDINKLEFGNNFSEHTYIKTSHPTPFIFLKYTAQNFCSSYTLAKLEREDASCAKNLGKRKCQGQT